MQISPIFEQTSRQLFQNSPPYNFIIYADSNFSKDSKNRKSVKRYCFFFNGVVILWNIKKQTIISLSVNKVKYIALQSLAREDILIML